MIAATTTTTKRNKALERASRFLTIAAFALALIATVIAPVLALSWRNQPFPGFVMDHTLVITDLGGSNWPGRAAGMQFGQKLIRLGGNPVTTTGQYSAALAGHVIGDRVSVFTLSQAGTQRLYPAIQLIGFPIRDFLQLFWMPYILSLGYLGIGFWIYRARGGTLPGRTLAFFCFSTTIVTALYFDVYSSHFATPLWSLAMAMVGGALISLAMRFPVESEQVTRYRWLLAVPYLVSIALAVWSIGMLYNTTDPWAYVQARDWAYRYAALGGLAFLGVSLYQAFRSNSAIVRRQSRIVLLGSLISFGPLMTWILTPLAGVRLQFNPFLYMTPLVLFPFSVAIAIFRYRLLEMDAIVNRTIVWGVLTAILAGVISVSVTVLQRFFVATTGEKSDVAVVLTSLILVSVFTPIKTRLQAVVDRTFKDTEDRARTLKAFGEQVSTFVQFGDSYQITHRLLEEAVKGLGAQSGAVSLAVNGGLEMVHTTGHWRGEAWVSAPLEYDGIRYGLLLLGPRRLPGAYSRDDFIHLQRVAASVAHALHVTQTWRNN